MFVADSTRSTWGTYKQKADSWALGQNYGMRVSGTRPGNVYLSLQVTLLCTRLDGLFDNLPAAYREPGGSQNAQPHTCGCKDCPGLYAAAVLSPASLAKERPTGDSCNPRQTTACLQDPPFTCLAAMVSSLELFFTISR